MPEVYEDFSPEEIQDLIKGFEEDLKKTANGAKGFLRGKLKVSEMFSGTVKEIIKEAAGADDGTLCISEEEGVVSFKTEWMPEGAAQINDKICALLAKDLPFAEYEIVLVEDGGSMQFTCCDGENTTTETTLVANELEDIEDDEEFQREAQNLMNDYWRTQT